MKSSEIRRKFLKFFEERGHVIVPSSSLVPDDPSVLLTTAGMQQFKRYYTGEADAMKDFGSKSTVSIQKSFRTSDIDEVGDERHLTFFEMMGNFSFGGYFKEEAITYAFDFITKEMGLLISYVTVFQGSPSTPKNPSTGSGNTEQASSGNNIPKDTESKGIWESLGVKDVREEGMDDVFWGPTGSSGPCGPTTEIYCKNGAGQDIEVWNIVFNEFFCTGSREELLAGRAELKPLPTKGIDTGMGLERLAMCAQKTKTIFETDLFGGFLKKEPISGVTERVRRIVLDHARAIAFLISDGVEPSNKGAGYILRRLVRRAMVYEYLVNQIEFKLPIVFTAVHETYARWYPELSKEEILNIFEGEKERFLISLEQGLKELKKFEKVDVKSAFFLFQSFGIPYEVIKELGGERTIHLKREDFEKEFEEHQEISRAGLEKKFGGHGLILDTGELKAGDVEELRNATRLHTTTHLLQQALRDVLGDSVHQMGSDVTSERTRFDFSFARKLTSDEIGRVEKIVNKKIEENLPVGCVEMSKEEAERSGALHFFKEKYPDKVKVYYVGETLLDAYSKEFCGGPHVGRTEEIGRVKISKEEAVASGVRRMRVVLTKDAEFRS
ncbi:hypothetical protein A3A21_00165 [Candidatus Jorgensenbacteria bacterium RIFCSPLOWO2_01_FULL_45_25b]|uniref:alanine--tRNA ligase n=1 Tax=Candidatus Jorgensenbacteria bacterium RIFCSPLOWO2_01_FULL_45_25b TaxID=1798471 RepID=A0A1F6BT32_9BACT|nr:MAG: hypothetical protein A3A21_00165 [Candidatus Jorgensenbacteria bacterium RIFCSPLOWO2_01_FULL_45_25b]